MPSVKAILERACENPMPASMPVATHVVAQSTSSELRQLCDGNEPVAKEVQRTIYRYSRRGRALALLCGLALGCTLGVGAVWLEYATHLNQNRTEKQWDWTGKRYLNETENMYAVLPLTGILGAFVGCLSGEIRRQEIARKRTARIAQNSMIKASSIVIPAVTQNGEVIVTCIDNCGAETSEYANGEFATSGLGRICVESATETTTPILNLPPTSPAYIPPVNIPEYHPVIARMLTMSGG